MKLYTVRDIKTGTYINPFPCPSERDAIENFSQVANDKTHQMGKFPEDFTLFELGEFDQRTGKIHIESEMKFITHAQQLVNKNDQPQKM